MSWCQFIAHLSNKNYCHPKMKDSFDALSYCDLSKSFGEVSKDKERTMNEDVSRGIVPKKQR